jgi:pSer/pThr/pTyr-binding forkhead associated (FHA) protein
MNAEVILTVVRGAHVGKEYVFRDHTVCTVGRGIDCLLQLPSDLVHLDVSRRHCLFDIDPPEIRVRDLGSRNGTYVNERKIGQRRAGLSPSAVSEVELPEYVLEDGDEVRVGGTVYLVNITGAAEGAGVPEDSLEEDGVLA